jgi:hypothetical protein
MARIALPRTCFLEQHRHSRQQCWRLNKNSRTLRTCPSF